MSRASLILFVRSPELGRGKRRLARDIGAVAALRFQRLMIERLGRRLARDRRWSLRLAVTPDRASWRRRLWPRGTAVSGQGGGDLGERMKRALAAARHDPVLLIGSDIPALGAPHVATALRLLGTHDLVFGPTEDGGFWLVGLRGRRHLPALFARVRWSSPHTLADTLAGLPKGWRIGLADRLEDVDDGAAYRRLMRVPSRP